MNGETLLITHNMTCANHEFLFQNLFELFIPFLRWKIRRRELFPNLIDHSEAFLLILFSMMASISLEVGVNRCLQDLVALEGS